jgi:hypothetical protein
MDKSTDLVVLIVAIWRLGGVYVPLFTAFVPQAIAMRLEGSGCQLVVADPGQRAKLVPGPDLDADPDRRILVTGTRAPEQEGDLLLADVIATALSEPLPVSRLAARAPWCTCSPPGPRASPRASFTRSLTWPVGRGTWSSRGWPVTTLESAVFDDDLVTCRSSLPTSAHLGHRRTRDRSYSAASYLNETRSLVR